MAKKKNENNVVSSTPSVLSPQQIELAKLVADRLEMAGATYRSTLKEQLTILVQSPEWAYYEGFLLYLQRHIATQAAQLATSDNLAKFQGWYAGVSTIRENLRSIVTGGPVAEEQVAPKY